MILYNNLPIKNDIRNKTCHFRIPSFKSKNFCYDLRNNLNKIAIRMLAIIRNITRTTMTFEDLPVVESTYNSIFSIIFIIFLIYYKYY